MDLNLVIVGEGSTSQNPDRNGGGIVQIDGLVPHPDRNHLISNWRIETRGLSVGVPTFFGTDGNSTKAFFRVGFITGTGQMRVSVEVNGERLSTPYFVAPEIKTLDKKITQVLANQSKQIKISKEALRQTETVVADHIYLLFRSLELVEKDTNKLKELFAECRDK